MREITEYPRPVREIENVFIPLADGRRLAARLWLPEDAESEPVPAVIEYMPYRKRDHLRPRDSRIHHYLAGHGYACLRVDVRGSGDSDGVLRGEWEEGELDDGVEMIEWAARQPWSSGAVGMIGKSWSGFTCLTLAARAPAPLKAIVPVCCGDDRYHQSLHWTGGAFLLEQLWWTDTMVLFNARPPDPAIVGEDWRRMWQERLDDNAPWIDTWLDHQRRDAFWRHASICEDWSAIRCPVFAVGGWADYLSRSVPRLLANLDAPCWGLIGPWGHHYPHEAMPGPAVGFLQECVRFYDRFLKDLPNGYEETPAYRVWMQDYRPPAAEHGTAPGRWVAEAGWPSPHIAERAFTLNPGGLDDETGESAPPAESVELRHRSPLTHGLTAPDWLCMSVPGELPGDQRPDDAVSLAFDSDPLGERLEILGQARLELDCAVDRPVAQLVARLVDAPPEGPSVRVSLAVLNLTHRDDHGAPEALEPGRRMRITVDFPDVGYAFAAGHRVRLALSTSYWPVVWPAPEPVTITVHTGTSRLVLPERPATGDAPAVPEFGPAEAAPTVPMTVLEPLDVSRRIERDPIRGETVVRVVCDGGAMSPVRRVRLDPIGTVFGHRLERTYRIRDDDPSSASADLRQRFEMERGGWNIVVETGTTMTATPEEFRLECTGRAFEGETLRYDKRWSIRKPRDLM